MASATSAALLIRVDLPKRFRKRADLNAADPATYYGGGAIGLVDHLTLAQKRGDESKRQVDQRWH
jgi:N-ethylmaleimide reductase